MAKNPEFYEKNFGGIKGTSDYCPDVFEKIERYTEACGLGTAKHFRNHRILCNEISDRYKIHVDVVHLLFSMTAGKPFLKLSKDNKNRDEILEKIVSFIKENKAVTAPQVRQWMYGTGALEIKADTVPVGKVAKKVMVAPPASASEKNGGLNARISSLVYALSPPQIQILRDAMVQFELDDELAAVSRAIILLKESMKVSG